MLEPTTISVPNLAARWNQTPSDILEHAAQLRLHLLFNFDGLVFDLNDGWLPGGKDWKQRRELEALTDFVTRAEAKFKRRINGQLSQWESLDSDEAVSLRTEVTAHKQAIEILNEMFDDRDRKRQQKHYRGALMAGPETVDELLRLGFAKHPIKAYRPDGPLCLRKVDGLLILDGVVVKLEAESSKWKARLEPADMVVSMADVNAIEVAAKSQQTANDPEPEQNAATTAPVSDAVKPASDGPAPPTLIHSTKTRRDALTPVIELAQSQCRNAKDAAEVWAALLVLADKKTPPLRGATEDGLQYLKGGAVEIFNRKSLGKRLNR